MTSWSVYRFLVQLSDIQRVDNTEEESDCQRCEVWVFKNSLWLLEEVENLGCSWLSAKSVTHKRWEVNERAHEKEACVKQLFYIPAGNSSFQMLLVSNLESIRNCLLSWSIAKQNRVGVSLPPQVGEVSWKCFRPASKGSPMSTAQFSLELRQLRPFLCKLF